MTRARSGVYRGVESFGHVSRAHVRRFSGLWLAFRAYRDFGVTRNTWAEALAYALEEDGTDDRETE